MIVEILGIRSDESFTKAIQVFETIYEMHTGRAASVSMVPFHTEDYAAASNGFLLDNEGNGILWFYDDRADETVWFQYHGDQMTRITEPWPVSVDMPNSVPVGESLSITLRFDYDLPEAENPQEPPA